jgi:hypothetical protein
VQPLPKEPFGQLGVAPAGAHEVGKRAEHTVPELLFGLEQRLGGRRQAYPLAIELRQRIAARRDLRQRLLCLATCRAPAGLTLFPRRPAAPPMLHCLGRRVRFTGLCGGALLQRTHLDRRGLLGRCTRGPLP